MKRVLSIDWDYFIDATIGFKLLNFPDGGNENLSTSLSNYIWASRYANNEELKKLSVRSKEFEVVKNVLFKHRGEPLLFTDSHAKIYDFISDYDVKFEIYNVDFHHDIYNNSLSEVNCGNWLYHLIKEGKVKKSVWISNLDSDKPNDMMGMEISNDINKIKKLKFDLIFICRSPVWSPPHLDKKLFELVSCGGLNVSDEFDRFKDLEEGINSLEQQVKDFKSSIQ